MFTAKIAERTTPRLNRQDKRVTTVTVTVIRRR